MDPGEMEQAQAKRILEAILFVVSQPVSLKRVGEILQGPDTAQIRRLIGALNEDYQRGGRAFQIQEVAGGYQLVTDPQLAPWIRRAFQSHKPDQVSAAAMETLAIIAYRQPVTKAEIEAIRGVDISASLETLVERGFVRIAGRKDSPGRPFLYGTTAGFLRHFGLSSIEALPNMDLPAVKEPQAEAPSATGVPPPAPGQADTPQPSPPEAAEVAP